MSLRFVTKYVIIVTDVVTCRVVRATKLTGASSDDWIYYYFGYNLS
jgi:hypothetical protein